MASLDKTRADAFWRFSLMFYGRPGVAEALIALQDRGGHNVNLVLFGLWLGLCQGAALDAAGLACAKAAIKRLDRDVVQKLRRLRRALRSEPDDDVHELRRRLLALELAAERRVQARLAGSNAGWSIEGATRAELAEANLRLILGGDFAAEEASVLQAAIAGQVGLAITSAVKGVSP